MTNAVAEIGQSLNLKFPTAASLLVSLGVFVFAGQLHADTKPAPPRVNGKYEATAYSVTGITASGEYTHRHVVAADPAILPIGSRIKIRRAGKYSGEYVVADTGQKIVGRKLDIYMPNTAECKKFGRKAVRIRVLELGDGTHQTAKESDQKVSTDVAKDVAKGAVGNAATEHDWATKGGKAKAESLAAAPATTPPATGAPANPAPPQL